MAAKTRKRREKVWLVYDVPSPERHEVSGVGIFWPGRPYQVPADTAAALLAERPNGTRVCPGFRLAEVSEIPKGRK